MKKRPDLSLDDFLTISGCSPIEPLEANDDIFAFELTGENPTSPVATPAEPVQNGPKKEVRSEHSKKRRRTIPAA